MKSVALATEDELSEAVGLRLLEEALHRLHVGLLFRKGGSGYLRSNVSKWCALAKLQPLLLLTDLDRSRCPSALIPDWLGEYSQPKDLVLRIAVREVEAWLLADHEAMRRLLGNKGKFPVDPDALPDPKQRLLELAKHANVMFAKISSPRRGRLQRRVSPTTLCCVSLSNRIGIRGARPFDRRAYAVPSVALMNSLLVYMRDEMK